MIYVDPPENRFLWMDFPAPERIEALSDELRERHADCFMVWNLSGTSYDTEPFGRQVVTLKFSGHLCPPLLMLVEACVSINAWLSADPDNVVAVHCRTGRGRSAVMLSCLLAWRQSSGRSRATASPGGGGPRNPLDWLSHLAQLRGADENVLTLPSHRRYLNYFGALLGGARPSGAPQQLRSIVLHSLPQLGAPPLVSIARGNRVLYSSSDADTTSLPPAAGQAGGCASYACTPPRDASGEHLLVAEDVMLSVREGGEGGALLFRAAFHVDLIPPGGVLRLRRAELDGVAKDLPAEAFVDVMVAPLNADGGEYVDVTLAPVQTPLWRAIDELCAAGGGAAVAEKRRPRPRFSLGEDEAEEEEEEAKEGKVQEGRGPPSPPPGGFPPPPPRRRQLLEELGASPATRPTQDAALLLPPLTH